MWDTEQAAIGHASWSCTPEDYAVEVGRKMFAEQCGVWHAAHLVAVERIDDGRTPTVICTICGGRNWPMPAWHGAGNTDHHICQARAVRGKPTPLIDVGAEMRCGCHPCRIGRRA